VRLGIALFVAIAVVPWASTRGQSIDGWQKLVNPPGYLHSRSGLIFPSQIEALKQLEPTSYEPQGRNSSIGYNASQHRLAITVYIYPKYGNNMPDVLSNELHHIQRAHPGMSVGMAGPMKMPFGGADAARDTFGAYIIYDLDTTEVGSLLVLVPFENNLLKLRATWVRSEEGLKYSMAQIRTLLASIARVDR